jgi:pyruvoyl-dependent arginine decarboxylase (PvlArgDC)
MPNTLRFTRGAGQDKTFRTVTQDAQQVAYAASIAITPVEQVNLVQVAQLTGALTLTAVVTNLFIGDIVRVLFSADATNRVVTFSTGFATAGTVTVTASKFAFVEFIFNGASLQEMGRAVTA